MKRERNNTAMFTKIVNCKICNYRVLAIKTKLNKKLNSDISFLDPKDNYQTVVVCPDCGCFLYDSVGVKFDYLDI